MKTFTVEVNDFVRRQVKGSGKSYAFDLSFETMARHAEQRLNSPGNHVLPGYRDGVCLVRAEKKYSNHFFCPLVKIDSTTRLVSKVIKRRKNENHYIQIRALNGSPAPAFFVDFILYRHDVLAENNENSTDAEWELISIHALPEEIEKLPMGPVTIMRNQLELTGGTAASYSSYEWAEAVKFWQKFAAIESKKIIDK